MSAEEYWKRKFERLSSEMNSLRATIDDFQRSRAEFGQELVKLRDARQKADSLYGSFLNEVDMYRRELKTEDRLLLKKVKEAYQERITNIEKNWKKQLKKELRDYAGQIIDETFESDWFTEVLHEAIQEELDQRIEVGDLEMLNLIRKLLTKVKV